MEQMMDQLYGPAPGAPCPPPTPQSPEPDLEVLNQDLEPKAFSLGGLPIITGKQWVPAKGIIYGDNGAGKTSMLAHTPKPFMLDMEGNSGHIEIPRARITSLNDFHNYLDGLLNNQHDYRTLNMDSLDSIQTFIGEKISSYGFQERNFENGKQKWERHINEIIEKLDKLHERKKMNILFTAHWKLKGANNPMTEQYDRYDLRINDHMRTGFCNWAQFILLLMKEATLEEKGTGAFGKKRADGDEKFVLYTHGTPIYYGKNVFNFPERMSIPNMKATNGIHMGWSMLADYIKKFHSK